LCFFFEWKLSRINYFILLKCILWSFEQKESPFSSYPKGGFQQSHNFHIRTQINFTHINKIEALHGKICVNGRVERRSTFMCLCRTFHTLSLILFTYWKHTKKGMWQLKSTLTTQSIFLNRFKVQVYFTLFNLIQYKMAYRISRLTNDEK